MHLSLQNYSFLILNISFNHIICLFSVEHDFRVQEGRFQNILEALDEAEYDVPAPIPKPAHIRPPTKSRVKKLRKKCFWWL